jgi:kumamolisin
MKYSKTSLGFAALFYGFLPTAQAQSPNAAATVLIPRSSIGLPGDAGVRAHTNIRILIPADGFAGPKSTAGPPYLGLLYQTPASAACIYALVTQAAGCNPNQVTLVPNGGSNAIAIVDAYHDPHAASDLAAFSAQFGLPAITNSSFEVVYASGVQPSQDPTGGWELEESLDIEWAHAMAPNATIFLVEAASNNNTDLFPAVAVASSLVAAAGGGEVSMSWTQGEFPGETSDDSYFTEPGVVYFAASGDGPGVFYPSASPNVVSTGGTTLSMSVSTGSFQQEFAWEYSGGGLSIFEPTPTYQAGVSGLNGARGTPDVAFDADPFTGVWVYDSTPLNGAGGPSSPWWIVGGTSVASPSLAGIANAAGKFASSTNTELTRVYADPRISGDFSDVVIGFCGTYAQYRAGVGYDFCTGLGSPGTYRGK